MANWRMEGAVRTSAPWWLALLPVGCLAIVWLSPWFTFGALLFALWGLVETIGRLGE